MDVCDYLSCPAYASDNELLRLVIVNMIRVFFCCLFVPVYRANFCFSASTIFSVSISLVVVARNSGFYGVNFVFV